MNITLTTTEANNLYAALLRDINHTAELIEKATREAAKEKYRNRKKALVDLRDQFGEQFTD